MAVGMFSFRAMIASPASLMARCWFPIFCLAVLGLVAAPCSAESSVAACASPAVCGSLELQIMCARVLACNNTHLRSTRPTPHVEFPLWLPFHKQLRGESMNRTEDVNVVFLGDSITESFRGSWLGIPIPQLRDTAATFYHRMGDRAAAYGIAGDETQHLLWRLQDHELANLQPKVVVLHIGTNNLGVEFMNSTETLAGIVGVVEYLLATLERTQVVAMGVLPCGMGGVFQKTIQEINQGLGKVAFSHPSRRVHTVDCGPLFLDPKGGVNSALIPDFIHPSAAGVDLLFKECLVPFLGRVPSAIAS